MTDTSTEYLTPIERLRKLVKERQELEALITKHATKHLAISGRARGIGAVRIVAEDAFTFQLEDVFHHGAWHPAESLMASTYDVLQEFVAEVFPAGELKDGDVVELEFDDEFLAALERE